MYLIPTCRCFKSNYIQKLVVLLPKYLAIQPQPNGVFSKSDVSLDKQILEDL